MAQVNATYVFGHYIDDTLERSLGTSSQFYHTDDLYSTVALTEERGTVIEHVEYEDYGQPRFFASDHEVVGASVASNSVLFTGRHYNPEFKLSYYRSRHLDPYLGRFNSRDSIGNWGEQGILGIPIPMLETNLCRS